MKPAFPHCFPYSCCNFVLYAQTFLVHPTCGVTLLPLRGALITSIYPGRCPGLCTSAPSGRKITSCEYGYTISATKSTYLLHAAMYHHSEYRMSHIGLPSLFGELITLQRSEVRWPFGVVQPTVNWGCIMIGAACFSYAEKTSTKALAWSKRGLVVSKKIDHYGRNHFNGQKYPTENTGLYQCPG